MADELLPPPAPPCWSPRNRAGPLLLARLEMMVAHLPPERALDPPSSLRDETLMTAVGNNSLNTRTTPTAAGAGHGPKSE